ncbi:MAG: SH3 domain-containing protein [Treponema sp.]|jgi:hypothetical protein|nr:SH3 domain-containing protein [Treponema sp.]
MLSKRVLFGGLLGALVMLGACSKTIGWGVILWQTADPSVPSGTVVPVYVRSNVEQAWIVAVPDEFRNPEGPKEQNMEVPLPHLELMRSKGAAEKRRETFGDYAKTYAETMQDGLPIREAPANNARRSYRLKQGEIIKILQKAEGVAAVGTSGSALEGEWFKVMTESGSSGFCFSYRLRLFEHEAGPLNSAEQEISAGSDRDLEILLTRSWYPESYRAMVDSGQIDLDYMAKLYSFKPGIASGTAVLSLESGTENFPYTKISKLGDRNWKFDGSSLELTLNSANSLTVSWERDGKRHTETFVTLVVSAENVVNQERERRRAAFQTIYVRGPDFQSANFGSLTFTENGQFRWEGMEFAGINGLGSGSVDMGYYLSGEMTDRYSGALAMRFDAVSGGGRVMVFAYLLDNQGLRLEYVPNDYVSRRTVSRRAPDPQVIYLSPLF